MRPQGGRGFHDKIGMYGQLHHANAAADAATNAATNVAADAAADTAADAATSANAATDATDTSAHAAADTAANAANADADARADTKTAAEVQVVFRHFGHFGVHGQGRVLPREQFGRLPQRTGHGQWVMAGTLPRQTHMLQLPGCGEEAAYGS